MVTEGVFTPAHVLAEAIRRREVSSVEIVDAYLAQIARHNPRLNAVVTLDDDGARVKAQEADAALGRGEVWGMLHGVPITLEDAHPTSGMRSTWGGLPLVLQSMSRPRTAPSPLGSRKKGPSCWASPTARRSGRTRCSLTPTTPGISRVLRAARAPVLAPRWPPD